MTERSRGHGTSTADRRDAGARAGLGRGVALSDSRLLRDLRDPTELGHKLLHMTLPIPDGEKRPPLSEVADHAPLHVRDYDANPGPIEKYGRPQDLPSTMPNAAE